MHDANKMIHSIEFKAHFNKSLYFEAEFIVRYLKSMVKRVYRILKLLHICPI